MGLLNGFDSSLFRLFGCLEVWREILAANTYPLLSVCDFQSQYLTNELVCKGIFIAMLRMVSKMV